jgi:hypothetical protein
MIFNSPGAHFEALMRAGSMIRLLMGSAGHEGDSTIKILIRNDCFATSSPQFRRSACRNPAFDPGRDIAPAAAEPQQQVSLVSSTWERRYALRSTA